MANLAARVSPHLSGLTHPGNGDDVKPFPLILAQFQRAELPEAMRQHDAEQLGLPTPDLNLHVVEAVLHLIENIGDVELVDRQTLTDLRAAATAREHKRNAIKPVHCTACNTVLFRATIKDFDTDHPRITPEVITALHGKSADCDSHR